MLGQVKTTLEDIYVMPGQLKKLIATFKRNPMLATLVRSIGFKEYPFREQMNLEVYKTLFARLLMQTQNVSILRLDGIWYGYVECLPDSFGFTLAPRIEKLVCYACCGSLDFIRQFPQLRVLVLKGLGEIWEAEGRDYAREPPWKHTGVEELHLQVDEPNIKWYNWILKRFPSLRTLRIGDFEGGSDYAPPLELLQSNHIPATMSHLLEAIQTKYPSIEMLHLAEFAPTVFEGVGSVPPAPLSVPPFPEFPNLTHLALSSHYLDYSSSDNPFSTVCRNCPRLQSLSLLEAEKHGLEFCDNLLGFAMHIEKTRHLGRDFAIYLKAIKVSGDWRMMHAEEYYAVTKTQGADQKIRKSMFNEYWMSISERWAAHPHASVFRSVGISYEENLIWPWTHPRDERSMEAMLF